jgi:hypothetical protein
MEYTFDDIDKIADFKTWSEKEKLDELFRIDTWMYTNLGSDSTKKDREEVKKKSRRIYSAIKRFSFETGRQCLSYMDR